MSRTLIVENEPYTVTFLTKDLKATGFTTHIIAESGQTVALVVQEDFDLITLDVGLSGIDGSEALQQLCGQGVGMSVIMLAACSSVADRAAGLEGDADGYMPKPLSFEEFLARIRVRLCSDATSPDQMRLIHRDTVLNLRTRTLMPEGRTVEFSAQEFALAETFMRYPGQVLSHEQLLSAVWRLDSDSGPNVVRVYVSYLRNKLGRQWMETMRGVGYQLI